MIASHLQVQLRPRINQFPTTGLGFSRHEVDVEAALPRPHDFALGSSNANIDWERPAFLSARLHDVAASQPDVRPYAVGMSYLHDAMALHATLSCNSPSWYSYKLHCYNIPPTRGSSPLFPVSTLYGPQLDHCRPATSSITSSGVP